MSLIANRIFKKKLKENIFNFKELFYLTTIGGDLLLQLWLNTDIYIYSGVVVITTMSHILIGLRFLHLTS